MIRVGNKKIIVALCFVLITGLIAFNFLIFTAYIALNKTTFRKKTLESELVLQMEFKTNALYKNQNGVEWKDKNKELIHEGIFYEVLNVIVKNDAATVYLLKDDKETHWHKVYFSLHQEQDNALAKIACFFNSLVYTKSHNIHLYKPFTNHNRFLSFNSPKHCFQFENALIKPPQAKPC